MSKYVWLLCFMAFGIALTGNVNAESVSHDTGSQTGTQQPHSKPKPDAPPAIPVAVQNDIHGIASSLKIANEHPYAEGERQRAKDELKAQQDTVFWAAIMVGVALLETLVTAAGVFLVWKTLAASRDAAREAKRAADAAEKTVKVTRNIGRAQVRAYVSVAEVGLEFINMGAGFQPHVAVVLKNTGNSPARRVVWNPTIQFASGKRKRTRSLVDNKTPEKWARTQEIPADDRIVDRALLAEMFINQFAQGVSGFGVIVRLKITFLFVDVFGAEIAGEAYFNGLVQHTANNGAGSQEDWRAILTPGPKPNDWDDPDSE